MSIEIKSIKGYYYLEAWVMSHIIHQATISFCQRYLNKNNDPSGRLYDQMVMAARSAPANIAEGCSRRQTSRETEMRLTDVARATLSELLEAQKQGASFGAVQPTPTAKAHAKHEL